MVILDGHFGRSFLVIAKLYSDPNFGAIVVEILSTADVGIVFLIVKTI